MNKILLSTLLFLFCFSFNHAQEKINYRPSIDVFQDAIKSIENKEYIEAIGILEVIHPNDTSYQEAQQVIIGLNIDLENYEKVVELCDYHLSHNTFDENLKLFTYKAEALLNLENYSELDNIMVKALEEYPNSGSLYYFKAQGFQKQKQYDKAVELFQKAIFYNPFRQMYHYKLGLIYADANQPTRSFLAINFCILLNPSSNVGKNAVKFLNDYATGNYTPEEEISLTKEDKDLYSEMDLIIRNKIALDPKYKLNNKLEFNINRQNQLLFETLKLDESSIDFCNQNYERFFDAMQKRTYFNEFCYHAFSGIELEKVQKIVSKNEAKTNAFINWAKDELDKTMYYREFEIDGKKQATKSIYGGDFGIEGYGEMNNLFKPIGHWVYLNGKGKKSFEITYSDLGKKEGETKGYYDNGQLYYQVYYKNNDINGEKQVFYDNGSRKIITNVVDGLNDGVYKEYFPTDVIRFETKMEKGREKDYYDTYFANGAINTKMLIKNNEIDGKYLAYHPNGKEKEVSVFVAGKREGDSKTFFISGNLHSEGKYVAGEREGAWKFYYDNGQVSSEGSYKKDIMIGEWKEYHLNGKLKELSDYGTNGKKTGIVKMYNLEGNLVQELTYDGDDITAYTFRDSDGKILTEGSIEKKELKIVGKYPNGNQNVEGTYKKSERIGKWKFYSSDGVLSSVENYNDEGKLDGKITNYIGDGIVENVTRYEDNQQSGYFEDYYNNGKLYEQGNYCEDQRCGLWIRYYRNGTIKKTTYYLDGAPAGFQTFYDEKGKKTEQYSYEDGYYKEFIRYDTTGKEINHFYFNKEEQPASIKSITGEKYMESTYKGSMLDGDVTWYNFGKEVEVTGHFINDNRHGLFTYYDVNGKLSREINYSNGLMHGKSKGYFSNGKTDYEGEYYEGDKIGEWTYYNEDGSLYSKLHFLNGERNGKAIYYVNGEVAYTKYYYDDVFYAYSYLDASGNEVEPILLKEGTGTMTAYYKNGKKAYELEYDHGLAQGKFTRWYPSGKIYKEGTYKDDYLTGPFKVYTSNGTLLEDENYVDDLLEGSASYFYPNGKKKVSFSYIMGTKYGVCTYYAESGSIISQFLYYNGNAIKKIK